jgi:uracil-DNA glycosylase
MTVKIETSWKEQLEGEFSKEYFKNLTQFVKDEYLLNECFPPGNLIFSAFNRTPFNKVKVVIIGQDPYHGINQANGLCFSVNDTISHPPSLMNIFKEIESDLLIPYPKSGNLERWADQGILLLNATLTVRSQEAGSHQKKGWEQFTDAIISLLSEKKENVVFLLWGGFAKKKGAKIDSEKHLVLSCGHPSPLSANRGYWFGNKHFSATNTYLEEVGIPQISW